MPDKEAAICGLGERKTSKAIALDLDISVKTVENHRHNLMTKAGATSVAQLIAWASEPPPG